MMLSELAARLGLEHTGDDLDIKGVNALENAGPGELSFISDSKYHPQLKHTSAGAVVIRPEHADRVRRALKSNNPYLDFARAVHIFYRPQGEQASRPDQACIHPAADIDPTAVIHPMVFIGAGTRIGAGCRIFPHTYIGENVTLGRECLIYPQVSIMSDSLIKDRVIIHPGAVIGSDGFGFVHDGEKHFKIPQVGRVVVEEDVEIGACTTIDRASLGETRIGRGTKIDNMVQIAHNVTTGQNCILISQVGISGSVRLGSNVILGGQVGVAGHLTIEDNCRVAAKSGVGRSLPADTDAGGIPAMEHTTFLRNAILLPKLSQMNKRIRQLEKEIQAMKKPGQGEDQ
ncbi:UDP-3-O-(3-hydroxymyristoyl)glucosamine N-acyltransferase [Desulfonatronospira sp.]|uniref:UDP-3-O-(3-hydroxymyristoyl)glucosamine N-acyltransferase n=1 Tax=Desulfonatronospira sp. TaxID=1962951 RepID=UPI0025C4E6FA|nr:UDP-3-O-(3-hydroxymyristoyl)glucosamine N-acyltransferase [Desulfonatronospira sp.]